MLPGDFTVSEGHGHPLVVMNGNEQSKLVEMANSLLGMISQFLFILVIKMAIKLVIAYGAETKFSVIS
jgi:hypothetical protein